MPIVVKHDPAATGGLAALALMAGAGQMPGTGSGGGGGGGGGRAPSYPSGIWGHGAFQPWELEDKLIGMREQARLEGQLQAQQVEQRKEAELEMLQQQQMSEVWVYEYSPQQRREMAKYTNELQQVASDPSLTDSERQVALRQVNAKVNAIQPVRRPKTSEEQMQEAYAQADGVPVGQPFIEPRTGALLVRDLEGLKPRLLVRPDQLPGAKLYEKQQAVLEKRRDLLWRERKDIANTGKSDEQLKLEIARVYPLPEDTSGVMAPSVGQEITPEQPIEAPERPQETGPMLEQLSSQGYPVEPGDFVLPAKIAESQVTLRAIRNKYEGKAPPADAPEEIKAMWEWHSARLVAWEEEQKRKSQEPEKTTSRRGFKRQSQAEVKIPMWGSYGFGI